MLLLIATPADARLPACQMRYYGSHTLRYADVISRLSPMPPAMSYTFDDTFACYYFMPA